MLPSYAQGKTSWALCVITVSSIIFIAVFNAVDLPSIFKQPILVSQQLEHSGQQEGPIRLKQEKDAFVPFAVGRTESRCHAFDGRWVYNEASRPLYAEHDCPLIPYYLKCQAHERPDKAYQNWRWQPHGCSLPSFNATLMLEKLQGKRMMFVGDSLGWGQFYSMVCLLHHAIPEGAKSFENQHTYTIFRATDYNTSIEYHWAPFLVESDCDDPAVPRSYRTVYAGSIHKHAQEWKGVDVLVFNTYIWWMTGVNTRILREPMERGMKDAEELEPKDGYRLALQGMVRWVEENMDPMKTRVFFNSMSATHERSEEWGGEPNGNCYNQTTPIDDPNYWGSNSDKSMMQIVEEVLSNSKVPIALVNITQLSEYRKDAHPSIYKQQQSNFTPEQLANPRSHTDCIHWCLPGLPDTWNELLYTKLFFP